MSRPASRGRGPAPLAQEGLFDKAYEQMFGENESAGGAAASSGPPLKNKLVKLTVRLFQPLVSGKVPVAEMLAYRKEWRFKSPLSGQYIESLKRLQKRIGTTIVVLENDVVRSHHTLESAGWVVLEERTP